MELKSFKQIMSSFPSGVAVVTVADLDGALRGLTCSAVCSVSLAPAMLLICVAKTSTTLPAIQARQSFVVNFLAETAERVARICASKSDDKFSGLNWRPSIHANGAPILLEDVVAYAECSIEHTVDAGDHLVIIARVAHGETCPARDPMIHAGGRFRQIVKSSFQAA